MECILNLLYSAAVNSKDQVTVSIYTTVQVTFDLYIYRLYSTLLHTLNNLYYYGCKISIVRMTLFSSYAVGHIANSFGLASTSHCLRYMKVYTGVINLKTSLRKVAGPTRA